MPITCRFKRSLLLPLLVLGSLLQGLGSPSAQAQESATYNRFQYHKYIWEALHTPLFHIYFTKGNDSLASFASVHLPGIMEELNRDMGVTLKDIPNIMIYPSPDQLYESNVGIYENKVQRFPTINLKGNRLLVAFDGSWEQFREQIKEAWARICWESQFKDNIGEQLMPKEQLMPAWFREGAIRYYTKGWDLADEAVWISIVDTKAESLGTSPQRHQALAGQAFCYFLSQRYRKDATNQIIFQLRQGKSLARSVRLVTKRTLDTLQQQCQAFYQDRSRQYVAANATIDTLKPYLEQRFTGNLFACAFNKDSSWVYFVIEKGDKRKIYLTTIAALREEKQHTKPFAQYLLPPWLEASGKDRYPLMDWEGQGKGLFLLQPLKGSIVVQQYSLMGNLHYTNKLYGVDGANDIWNQDKGRFLLSAYRKGRSDIVQYDAPKLHYTALTADQGDHTELAVNEKEGVIAYRSGYPADSLYHKDTMEKPYGIYTKSIKGTPKDIAKQQDKLLYRDSAYLIAQDPVFGEDGKLTLLLREDGVIQRHGADKKSADYRMSSPWLKDYLRDKKEQDSIQALLDKLKKEDVPLLRNILPTATKEQARQHQDSMHKTLAYTPQKVRPYILQLYSAYFSAQANNDYYINRYQPYQSYLGSFKFPEVGAMVQGGFSDLFDNHQFNIGYRMPAGTEGSDFFVRYGNSAKKLDWHLLYFRKMESLQPDAGSDWKDNRGNPYPLAAKVKTHYYELGFHYPLRYDWSLDLTTAARNDQTIFLATDRYSLRYDPLKTWWSINTLSLSVHKLKGSAVALLYQGWEGKVLVDGMASTGKNSTLLYGTKLNLAWHQPLFRNINLVTRVQAGHSGGSSKILYNFGGTDNNVVPRVDTSVRFAQDAPYAFQTLVTPFRGYEQNSIYGSSFVLTNIDLYVPLFQGLIPLKTNFSMVNNLQLGVFVDMAATKVPVPVPGLPGSLVAYGCSARTMLAGYPVRFDMAWPATTGNPPIWYLSLKL